jgi:hypothetical protein
MNTNTAWSQGAHCGRRVDGGKVYGQDTHYELKRQRSVRQVLRCARTLQRRTPRSPERAGSFLTCCIIHMSRSSCVSMFNRGSQIMRAHGPASLPRPPAEVPCAAESRAAATALRVRCSPGAASCATRRVCGAPSAGCAAAERGRAHGFSRRGNHVSVLRVSFSLRVKSRQIPMNSASRHAGRPMNARLLIRATHAIEMPRAGMGVQSAESGVKRQADALGSLSLPSVTGI